MTNRQKQTISQALDSQLVQHVSQQSLASIVYANIKNALAKGELLPGHKLSARDLCKQLGVSQTPVREAMLQLVAERALTLNPNRSITVPELTRNQFIELRDIRVVLEGLAAAHAARVAKKKDVDAVVVIHKDLLIAKKKGVYRETLRLNRLLHFSVYELSQREELVSLIDSFWARTGPYLNFLYQKPPISKKEHPHEALIQALRTNSPKGAQQAIEIDIIQGGASIVDALV